VSGFENHLYLVSCSDFNGDPAGFAREMEGFIRTAQEREPFSEQVRLGARGKGREHRLGFIGVPPIFPELYDFLEEHGARVVFNEVQRQFAMPFETEDVVEQYRLYTYPYKVFQRLEDIAREAARRQLDGIIHYTQSFCYREIEDLIIRKKLDYPILTLEGENPTGLDARSKMRVESFLSMLGD
jgi:benzoyl-CoA reductase/2-hydroxyglutaryl-CoA dehydratase subunit BcrC/BadD/HgdB